MDKKMKTLIILISLVVGVFGAEKILEIQDDFNNTNIIENQSGDIEKESYEIKEESNVIIVNNENFEEEVLKSEKVVLVDFYATWCNPCKILAPTIEEFAKENENIKVVKIDIDEAYDTAIKYGVSSIPTLIVIEKGEEKNRVTGVVSKEYISEMVLK